MVDQTVNLVFDTVTCFGKTFKLPNPIILSTGQYASVRQTGNKVTISVTKGKPAPGYAMCLRVTSTGIEYVYI